MSSNGRLAALYPLTPLHVETMLAEGRSTPPARRCWMVCRNGAPVGHAQLAYEWHDGNARLGRVAVAPAMRGQGLARPLTALMIQEAFSTPGIERLELNVYMFNQPALRTYEALGSSSKACVARRRGSASSDGIPASWGCCATSGRPAPASMACHP